MEIQFKEKRVRKEHAFQATAQYKKVSP